MKWGPGCPAQIRGTSPSAADINIRAGVQPASRRRSRRAGRPRPGGRGRAGFGVWKIDHKSNVVSSQGGTIFVSLRSALPLLDRSIHALVTDLHERGLDKEVLVLVWGEFGRTPKISQNGRDHWPDAGFALFAGAVRGGQVVGQTDSRGERPKTRAVGAQNVIGTVYQALGIDAKQKLPDFSGRPVPLLDDGEPIAELVG
jgi:hypothetical protein